MDQSQTRPGELSRISALANGDPYRTEVLLLLMQNREASRRHEEWQVAHDKLDNERHADVITEIAGLKTGLGSATSGVNSWKETREQVVGARKLVVGLVAALTALGGFIYFLAWAIKELHK